MNNNPIQSAERPKPRPTRVAPHVLDTYIEGIKHLPPTPTLMIQLLELFRKPDTDVDEVVTLLSRDPALSVEVLRRCNSAFFSQDTPVMDINEAVFRMGFYELYQMTMSLYGMRVLTPKTNVPGFSAEALQRHSNITAIASGALALELEEPEGVAFTAGLLHDVGKLVLALGERDKYVTVMEECRNLGISLSAMEKMVFGFNHDEVGARLLQRWGVPVEVVMPALGHNDPEPSGEWNRFVAITNMSSRMANYIEQKKAPMPFAQLHGVKPLIDFLKLKENQLTDWQQVVRTKVQQLQAN
ncbi:MAG TPA: HDOD domain-containing protein [Verrucomicrobiae bacterium]|jgi:putative nucleotidyltransferase with HDIG domain|nr:HDOD domain-containing protein [Verrucomicrobiae bacterium]